MSTCSNTINLLNQDSELPIIDEGESADIVGALKLGSRNVTAGEVQTFTLTVYREADKTKLVDARDVIADLAADGTYAITIGGADTAADPATNENETEWHVVRLIWSWIDAVSAKVRQGKYEGRYQVKRLNVI